MKNSVLLYDPNSDFCKEVAELLTDGGVAVFGTSDLGKAADHIFSDRPPAVFVTDCTGVAEQKWFETLTLFEEIRVKYNLEAGSSGNSGALSLVAEVQKRVRDTRIILISGSNPRSSAEKIGAFGYVEKPIWDLDGDNSLPRLVKACNLGPLRPEEMDITGKLKEGPLDLRLPEFQRYLEHFRRVRVLERE